MAGQSSHSHLAEEYQVLLSTDQSQDRLMWVPPEAEVVVPPTILVISLN
jgi:hypothetical protein